MCIGKYVHIFEISNRDFSIHCATYMFLPLRQIRPTCQNSLRHRVTDYVAVCVCAKSPKLQTGSKTYAIVLDNVDLRLRASTCIQLAAFRAICSHIHLHCACTETANLRASDENSDIRFPDPDFFIENHKSTMWSRFPLLFHSITLMFATYMAQLTFWPRKYVLRNIHTL